MRVLIIGGSGRIGQLVIEDALKRGHTVTALVRSSNSLEARPGLTLITGSPLSTGDVERAFLANGISSLPEAVVSTLNARRTSDSPFAAPSADTPPRLMADAAENLLQSMKKHGVRKLVAMSSLGTGDSMNNSPWMFRLLFQHSNMKWQFVDHNAVDQVIREAASSDGTDGNGRSIDFVLIRSCVLADGEAAPVKVLPDNGQGVGLLSKITKKSVASFIVDAIETNQYDGRAPVIMN